MGAKESGDAREVPDSVKPEPDEMELKRFDQLLPLLRVIENPREDLGTRVVTLSALSRDLSRLFLREMTQLKGRILSYGEEGEVQRSVQLVDLLSIRVRGVVDRLYSCMENELSGKLRDAGLHLCSWSTLSTEERSAVLQRFNEEHLSGMKVAPEWSPSFVPEMPLSGCAVGVLARYPDSEGTRFFHMVLPKDQPSFLQVPGTHEVLPLEEAVRGYFLTEIPELAGASTHMFRFTTGAATVREPAPLPETMVMEESEPTKEDSDSGGLSEAQARSAPGESVETRQSVVVRIMIHQSMPESYQGQLLRALERQVNRANQIIGLSDLFPV